MNEQGKNSEGGLVPAGRHDLTPVTAFNPLVSRGIADLSRVERKIKVQGEISRRPKDFVRASDGWYGGWQGKVSTPAMIQVDPEMRYSLWIEKQRTNDYLVHLGELAATFPLWALEIHKSRCLINDVSGVLAKLYSVRQLMLNGCSDYLTDSELVHLASLRDLEYLSLDGAIIVSDLGLANLRGLTALRELDLSYCLSITDSGLGPSH